MALDYVKKLNIPTAPGCYQFYNKQGKIIYIGKAANLKSRVFSYWQKSANLVPAKFSMLKQIVKIKWIETESEIEAFLLESNLIKKYQPRYNVTLRDDKRFIYIKVSLEDEIPSVFLTRKIDRSGRYFGPFISAQGTRETVRAIRKIFPYCTMRKTQPRPCFYYQINRCLGVCGGKVGRQEYMDSVIKPLVLFFEGKKKKIIKNLEVRIKRLEKEAGIRKQESGSREEELVSLKFQMKNIKHVLENAKVLSVGEKYANDTVELAKLLGLPKTPERIEGYDVANIFGNEAVGSMVVFNAGEPDKNEYRKFKIKTGPAYAKAAPFAEVATEAESAGKQGDVQMLSQVLERRFAHSVMLERPQGAIASHHKGKYQRDPIASLQDDKQSWPMPDLIIIDGGKPQLNTALRVLKKGKLNIQVVAISKGAGLRSAAARDKLFFPGQAKPLELPLASPALHLIKRVRDEAHRFAIAYHRKLRSRAKFK